MAKSRLVVEASVRRVGKEKLRGYFLLWVHNPYWWLFNVFHVIYQQEISGARRKDVSGDSMK